MREGASGVSFRSEAYLEVLFKFIMILCSAMNRLTFIAIWQYYQPLTLIGIWMTINNSLCHMEVVATLQLLLQQERRIVSVLQRRSSFVLSVWAFTKIPVPCNACIPIVRSAWLVYTVHQSAVILCNAPSVVLGRYCQVVEFRVSMVNLVAYSCAFQYMNGHVTMSWKHTRTCINRHSW